MFIYPAIDLYEGKAVRLFKGDYAQMEVFSENPPEVAKDFESCGATHIHLVDLEGAKNGKTPNFDTVMKIHNATDLFCEIGGGIRSMETVEMYLENGIDRVILGTAAVNDRKFLERAVGKYKDRIAVGVDIRDGFVAIKGWTEKSELETFAFCKDMQALGVSTLICTDISKDGAMKGTNHGLYKELSEQLKMNIIASGGVSSLDDVKKLRALNIHGAIIGKAYYTKAINLRKAVELAL